MVEARVKREAERAEVPIIHLICGRLEDRSDLLRGLMEGGAPDGWSDGAIGRADEVCRALLRNPD